jgi:hypothetical protein
MSKRANPWALLRPTPHGVVVSKRELAKGIKDEMEHTRSRRAARTIALQHLVNDPHYYSTRSNPKRTFYHGTVKNFAALDVIDGFGIHVGTVQAALDRVSHVVRGMHTAIERRAIIEVAVNVDNVLELTDCGLWSRPQWIIDTLVHGLRRLVEKRALTESDIVKAFGLKPIVDRDYRTHLSSQFNAVKSRVGEIAERNKRIRVKINRWIRKGVMALGYDTIKYKNKFEAEGSMSYIILDPKRIVSQDVVEV